MCFFVSLINKRCASLRPIRRREQDKRKSAFQCFGNKKFRISYHLTQYRPIFLTPTCATLCDPADWQWQPSNGPHTHASPRFSHHFWKLSGPFTPTAGLSTSRMKPNSLHCAAGTGLDARVAVARYLGDRRAVGESSHGGSCVAVPAKSRSQSRAHVCDFKPPAVPPHTYAYLTC